MTTASKCPRRRTQSTDLSVSRSSTQGSPLRRAASSIGLLVFLVVIASSASAQFTQYTPPGSLGSAPENTREELERALDEARWTVGSFRVEPWYAIKDVAYVDNTLPSDAGGTSDVTATAGAGLKGYLPVSESLTLALHALPEYVWWQDQDERRQLNGRFGAGLFGFFANGSFEFTATRNETQRFVTSEFETFVSARIDRLAASAEVPLGGSIGLFGSAELSQHEHLEGEPSDLVVPALEALDREEQIVRAGVFYRRGGLKVGLGLEDSQVEFDDLALERSHEGTSPFLRVRHETERLDLTVDVVSRDLEGTPIGSAPAGFVAYDDPTGEARLHYFTGNRLRLGVYSTLQLGYSLNNDYSYFEAARSGLSVSIELGWRSRLSAFAETGTNSYVASSVASPPREDELSAFGGRLNIQLSDSLLASIGVSTTDYDSNIDVFDRDLTVLRAGLTLGRGRSAWW